MRTKEVDRVLAAAIMVGEDVAFLTDRPEIETL